MERTDGEFKLTRQTQEGKFFIFLNYLERRTDREMEWITAKGKGDGEELEKGSWHLCRARTSKPSIPSSLSLS